MYRKFKADHLFTGHEILPGSNVLVTTQEGSIIDIIDQTEAGNDIEIFKGILTPGFINCHCHVELSHLKGVIPTRTGLVEFVQQVMSKRTAAPSKSPPPAGGETLYDLFERQQAATFDAERELYDSGTVAIGDICNTADSIFLKQKSKIYWHNFIEVSGFVDDAAEKRLNDAKTVLEKFQKTDPKFQHSLSPHAPYSVSKTLFQLLNNETNKQLITIHNQESAAENELYKNKDGDFLTLYQNFGIAISGFQQTGKSSLQSWFPYFTNNQSIILVHNTFTSQDDINFLQSQKSKVKSKNFFCVCANANLYIEQKMPPLNLLRQNNCNIVIGTDSYASNWQLNMLEEIKTIQKETSFTIPLKEILQWATINGATALQVNDKLGSFEKGKQPGIVLIDEIQDMNTTAKSSARRIL